MTSVGAGYSGTPLPKKLGIRPGSRVGFLGAPDGFRLTLGPLPAGVDPSERPTGSKCWDVIVAFARTPDELEGSVLRGTELITWDGGLWIAWPKAASPLAGDLREGDVRARGLGIGLVDNKVCAIDADWSGLRFVHRREDRPG